MFDKKNTVILVAIEDELSKSLLPDWNIVYTGVGKINAALSIANAYNIYSPKAFINFGSAGSLNNSIRGLNEVSKFYQRDMDARQIGFPVGVTPFDSISTIDLKRDGLTCSSGDNFVTENPLIETDLVDMESYALAKFCYNMKLEFYCFKFVSDNANSKASNDWKKNYKQGSLLFVRMLNRPS